MVHGKKNDINEDKNKVPLKFEFAAHTRPYPFLIPMERYVPGKEYFALRIYTKLWEEEFWKSFYLKQTFLGFLYILKIYFFRNVFFRK